MFKYWFYIYRNIDFKSRIDVYDDEELFSIKYERINYLTNLKNLKNLESLYVFIYFKF